jgi:hypothetical protein
MSDVPLAKTQRRKNAKTQNASDFYLALRFSLLVVLMTKDPRKVSVQWSVL